MENIAEGSDNEFSYSEEQDNPDDEEWIIEENERSITITNPAKRSNVHMTRHLKSVRKLLMMIIV